MTGQKSLRFIHLRPSLAALVALTALLAGVRPAAAYTVSRIVDSPNFDQYLIEEPPISGEIWGEPVRVPEIAVRAGDQVLISNAGGCVQANGSWSPYAKDLNSLGGTIYLSGTAQFIGRQRKLATVLNEPLLVDASAWGPASFELGYLHPFALNPSYADVNNNLAGNPECDIAWPLVDPQTGRPSAKRTAYLYVNVFHGAARADVSALKRFDILPINGFWNKMPINPIWGIQALKCGYDAHFWDGRCMPQTDTKDFCEHGDARRGDFTRHEIDRTTSFSCLTRPSRIDFVNNPVIMIGPVEFEDHGFDDDYTFNMHPAKGEFADYNPRIHFEQDESETFEPITRGNLPGVAFWNDFYAAVHESDQKGKDKIRESLGTAPLAVVVGVPGLDCWHDGHVELHPAFAVALRVSLAPETWTFYYRNFGKTGMCGSEVRSLKVPGNKVSLKLPLQAPPPGMVIQSVNVGGKGVKWWMDGAEPLNVSWNVAAPVGGGTVITIQLPDPAVTRGGVAGTVVVNYTYGHDPEPHDGGGPGTSTNPCFKVEGLYLYCPPQTALFDPFPDPGPFPIRNLAEGPEEMIGLALDRQEPAVQRAYRAALAFVERQIGTRLGAEASSGNGGAATLPLSCALELGEGPPAPVASADFDPDRRPPFAVSAPDPEERLRTFSTLSICGLFSSLEGFPAEFCPDGALGGPAESPPSCPEGGCLRGEPTILLRTLGGSEAVASLWGAPEAFSPSSVLPASLEGGGSLLLLARESSVPFVAPVTLAGGAEVVATLFARSDFALVARDAAGGWTARPIDGESLRALAGEQDRGAPGTSSSGDAGAALLTCPSPTGI